MDALVATVTIATYAVVVYPLPPQACYANFRWDDCGKAPEPVMYYWKPGSRCEVGIWRGCLPNVNMFRDEYECVSTCIFSVRAGAPDWHNLKDDDETTPSIDFTDTITNETGAMENSTVADGTSGTDGGDKAGDEGGDKNDDKGDDKGDDEGKDEGGDKDAEDKADADGEDTKPDVVTEGDNAEETTHPDGEGETSNPDGEGETTEEPQE